MDRLMPKVFLWLFIGLFVSFGTAYYVSVHPNMVYNIFETSMYIPLLLVEIGIVVFLSVRIRKMKPLTAIVCYLLYSFLTGLTFSVYFLAFELSSILTIFGVTAFVVLLFAFLGYMTHIDLTRFHTFVFMALLGFLFAVVVNIFLGNSTLDIIISVIGILLFIFYVSYDIQKIKSNLYGIDQETNLAIIGAFELYIDFINLFTYLIRLFGNSRD